MKLTILKILILSALVSLSMTLFGQGNGSIRGTVLDYETKDILPGATISILGKTSGTITNTNGEFLIMNIPEGDYQFMVSFIGYKQEIIEKSIRSGETEVIHVELKTDATGLEEVVVTAQLLGQRAAINQQLNSDALANVVSSDKMRELPDVNAAEAVGRLPGVSVQRSGGEASKVVVRGISPNLTSVTINGVKLPATGTNDRAVDLSMISPELLTNIELFKSPTADMDGDFIGGVVNLGVTKAPNKAVTEVRAYGGYNGLNNNFSNYKGSFNLSRRLLDNKLGILIRANYENTDRSSERINVTWNKDNIDVGDVRVSKLKISDELKMIQRYGGSAQADYEFRSGYVMAQALYSARYNDKYTTINTLENAGRIFHSPRHSYGSLSTLQLLMSGKQQFSVLEIDWRLSKSYTKNMNPYDVSLDIIQYNGVETSEMELSPEALNAKRMDNYYDAQLEKFYFEPNDNEHENLQAAIDFKYDYSLGDKVAGFLKFGGKLSIDDRVFDHDYQQVYWYYLDQAYIDRAINNWPYTMDLTVYDYISLNNFIDGPEKKMLWDGKYSIDPDINYDLVDEWYETQKDELSSIYNEEYKKYTASEKVLAAYVMTKLKIGNYITLIPGIRYELSDNVYQGHYSDIDLHGATGKVLDSTSYQNYGEWLPSAHMKITPLSWMYIRASVAKTLARPDYNMVAPIVRLDLNDAVVYQSNPDLKHATAWNYDFSLSAYSNKLGLLTLGAFYKKFDNYFIKTTRRMDAAEALSRGYPELVYDVKEDYMNFDNSKVWGLEMELQTNLHYLPAPLNGMVVNLNLTRLWSETYSYTFQPYEYYDASLRRMVFLADSSYFEENATDLPNQVDWIANLSLGYEYRGFSIRISAIYQAAYLTGFSSRGTSETTEYFYSYVDDHLRFDASISQKIGEHFMLMASIANISGETERKYTWKPDYVTSDYRYGATFDIGLRYLF